MILLMGNAVIKKQIYRLRQSAIIIALSLIPMLSPADDDAKYAAELLPTGSEAPEFTMKTIDGGAFSLKRLRGKYVVLDFWASWCPDCRGDVPNIVRMYNEFHQRGVAFVGVSMDTDRDAWRAATEKYGMRYTHVSELKKMRDTDIAALYKVHWIPTLYLINPEGKIELSTVLSYKVEKALTERLATHGAIAGTKEDLWIRGDHGRLAATIQKPVLAPGARCPIAVIMHGFTGNKDEPLLRLIADSLQANGVASIRFDFNGHGKSEGRFTDMTVPNEVEDAKRVVRYVSALPWVSKVMVTGHSQGGVVASMTAGELGSDTISRVALLAPAAVLRDDAIRGNTIGAAYDPLDPPDSVRLRDNLYLGAKYIRAAFDLPIYETAARYQGPALIIHGTGDRVAPYTYGERYNNVWRDSSITLLDGFDHCFTQNVYRAADLAVRFLRGSD